MVLDLYLESEQGLLAIKGIELVPYQYVAGLYEVVYPKEVVLTQSVELALLIDRTLIDLFGIDAFHHPYT